MLKNLKKLWYRQINVEKFIDDLWSTEGKKLHGLVPQGWIVYGELIGWAGEKPIQAHYTYNVPKGYAELYIYRVAVINPQGITVDLAWDDVKTWCKQNGLNHVPELHRCKLGDLETYIAGSNKKAIDMYLDVTYYPNMFPGAVPLADDSPCDEGICIRIDGLRPTIVKAKSPVFLGHETKILDTGEMDMESIE